MHRSLRECIVGVKSVRKCELEGVSVETNCESGVNSVARAEFTARTSLKTVVLRLQVETQDGLWLGSVHTESFIN